MTAQATSPAPSEHCPTCGSPVHVVSSGEGTNHYEPVEGQPSLRAAVVEFLKRWDNPEVYHRLPAVDDLRAALAEPEAEAAAPMLPVVEKSAPTARRSHRQ